jgi:hypothetical protein
MVSPAVLVGQGEARVQFDLCDPRFDNLNGNLARIFEQVNGQVLAGEFARDEQAVDFAHRCDQAAEHRAAFEQSNQPPQPCRMTRGRQPGEATADDCDFAHVFERPHSRATFRWAATG